MQPGDAEQAGRGAQSVVDNQRLLVRGGVRHRDPVLRRAEGPIDGDRELPGQPAADRGADAVHRISDLGHEAAEHRVSAGVL